MFQLLDGWLTPPVDPSIRGAIIVEYRKRGDKVFGPYFARYWRERGRLRKAYVHRGDVDEVRALCADNKRPRSAKQQVREVSRFRRVVHYVLKHQRQALTPRESARYDRLRKRLGLDRVG